MAMTSKKSAAHHQTEDASKTEEDASVESHTPPQPFLRIAACSYEGSIFGWDVVEDLKHTSLQAKMSFGFNCCQSSLRCLAISQTGKYLACGGVDERIRLFDMENNKSLGEISNQSGSLTSLHFYGESYLISGAEVSEWFLSIFAFAFTICWNSVLTSLHISLPPPPPSPFCLTGTGTLSGRHPLHVEGI
jgi:WD40 repeat protein